MKNLYVVVDGEDINDTTINDPKRHKGWLLDEITELISSFADEESMSIDMNQQMVSQELQQLTLR